MWSTVPGHPKLDHFPPEVWTTSTGTVDHFTPESVDQLHRNPQLHRQAPEGRHRKLRTYANVGLLCVD